MSDINRVGYIPKELANFIFLNTVNAADGAEIDNEWKHKNDAQ